MTDCFEFRA